MTIYVGKMKTRFIIIPAVIIAASILVVIAIDSTNLNKICAEKGGVRNGDVCLIEIGEPQLLNYLILIFHK